jgi:PAS domain S-box-containing protein
MPESFSNQHRAKAILNICIALLAFLIVLATVCHLAVQSVPVWLNLLVGGALLLTLTGTGRLVYTQWVKPAQRLQAWAGQMAEGNMAEVAADVQWRALQELAGHLHKIRRDTLEATTFARQIGEGVYNSALESMNSREGLGKALIDMRAKLQAVAEEERKRNWTIAGVARFSDLLRDYQNASLAEISYAVVQHTVKYLGANQGGVYLLNDEQEHDPHIQLTACYAYEKKKYLQQRIEPGQGLVGQCLLENESVYLTEIPDNYLKITSGLGEATPRNILLVPVKSNDQTHGVLEIASFTPLEPYQVALVETVCGSFAALLSATRVNLRTRKLLDESQKITEELRAKEEVLRQNSEELLATQEELSKKVQEIEKESALIQSIVEAINKTNAALELDMDGNIIDVNEIYVSLMEYTREELIGSSEKKYVAADELDSGRYDMMWDSIRTGAFNSGEYRRVSKSGKELWLTGTYSPIYDISGKAYKIMQFAQFTTEQKERELELTSKINAINQAIAMLDVDPDGVISAANPCFMKEFHFKRSDLRNKALVTLLDPALVQSGEYAEVWAKVTEGMVMTLPLKFITKEGSERYYITSFCPSRNLAGNIHKILLSLIDITEQHRLKEHLKTLLQDEKRKTALLELQVEITDSFVDEFSDILLQLEEKEDKADIDAFLQDKKIPAIELDNAGNVLLANTAALNILGYEGAAFTGANLRSFLWFKDAEEEQYFSEKIHSPELSQLKIYFVIRQYQTLLFNVYMVPRFTEKPGEFTIIMLIMNQETVQMND